MKKVFTLNFWLGDGFGGTPIVLNSRSDAEEMALAFYQGNLYESFLHLLSNGFTIEEAMDWAYDDVDEYSIQEAAAFL